MDVLIVEDRLDYAQGLKNALLRAMPRLLIEVMRSESDFLYEFSRVAKQPPLVAILDLMLPWGQMLPKPARADAWRAGIRCAKKLREDRHTADAAVVLYTAARGIKGVPPGVGVFEKGELDQVVAYVRSALAARGVPAADLQFAQRVFVIHGHDDLALNEVKATIYDLKLQPIILKETPTAGMASILEHLEQNAGVDYAVAIMTPDDLGSLRGRSKTVESRPRQNVIFEIGYFLARLGRTRVTILTKGKVRQPSDLDGIVWTEMDRAGAWKSRLAVQMTNAGLDVDRALH
jgi:predicted nucleotide-binding protein